MDAVDVLPRSGRSLRWRLSAAFAGIAALAAVVIGLVLLPILAGHDATAERAYLDGAAERAVRDLGVIDWRDGAALRGVAAELAAVTQSRVTIADPKGAILVDLPAPTTVAPPPAPQPLPNPLGVALLGENPGPATLPRSGQSVVRPVHPSGGGVTLGSVRLSDAPAYEQVALVATAEAWLVASLVGVLAAALAGLAVAAWLTRPLRALTRAVDRMASGDLAARTDVMRGDELGALAVSFDAMADRTEGTVDTLRRFVADAAHEIGTPLTALQADLELAESNASSDDERRLLRRALGQAQRLGALAAGLLRLSRLEATDRTEQPGRTDLPGLVRRVADAVASRADQAEIDLRLELPNGSMPVVGDPDRLQTAVANLIDNALKFTPPGGSVIVAVTASDGMARLCVCDTGIGIPPDDLPGLFGRFHRGRNASGYEGSGLGLAIVRATAERYGGTVTATSDAAGSRFELSVPLG